MPNMLIIMESSSLQKSLLRVVSHSFTVTACNTIAKAAILLASDPDALILDLSSIGSDGLAFLEQYASQLPPVVLVLSCVTSPDVLLQLSRLHVNAVVRIPCTATEILKRLEACCTTGIV